jgi:hypothetical protein
MIPAANIANLKFPRLTGAPEHGIAVFAPRRYNWVLQRFSAEKRVENQKNECAVTYQHLRPSPRKPRSLGIPYLEMEVPSRRHT